MSQLSNGLSPWTTMLVGQVWLLAAAGACALSLALLRRHERRTPARGQLNPQPLRPTPIPLQVRRGR